MTPVGDKRLQPTDVNPTIESHTFQNEQIHSETSAAKCSPCEKASLERQKSYESWLEEMKMYNQKRDLKKQLRHKQKRQIRCLASAHRVSPFETVGRERPASHESWLEEMEKFKKKVDMRKQLREKQHRSMKAGSNKTATSTIPSRLDANKVIDNCRYSIPNRNPRIIVRKEEASLHRECGGRIHEPSNLLAKQRHHETVRLHSARSDGDPSAKSGWSPSARNITVNPFHAISFLDTRKDAEKTKILAQNGLTKSAAAAFNYLPQDNSSNASPSKIAKDNLTNGSDRREDPCAAGDSEEEQYVGHPFYIDGDDGTQQSKAVRDGPSETTSATTEEEEDEEAREKYFTPKCVLSSSLFPNVAPYLNFASHAKKGPSMPAELRKLLRWKSSYVTPRIVGRIVLNSGFRFVKHATDWTGVWEDRMRGTGFQTLYSHQKCNHMPGTYRIGRKDNIWRSIDKNIKKFGRKEFGFMPKTYIMPDDMDALRQLWPKDGVSRTKWIVKPPAGSRGMGIRVVSKWAEFRKDRAMVVQKYIDRPLLIKDSKFDMRLYVVVTSIDPLKIYMYKDGLARFASKKYSTAENRIRERCMHLTNYSINKYSRNYSKNENFNNCQGHKWTLQSLWSFLENRGVDTKRLWATLRDLVIRSIICGESGLCSEYRHNVNFRYNCYDLFGFDVLLDENMVPWLLEINIMPSLNSDLKLDRHVKGPLVQALMNTALYQVPPTLDDQQQADIIRELNLDCAYLCSDKRLFATCLTAEEEAKHNMYTHHSIELREQYLDRILAELSPDDVRCLILAEDELNRSRPLERIFPTATSYQYLDFLTKPRYYNRLLDAWENRYGNRRADGIKLIRQLCNEGYHLQVSDAIMNQEPTRMLTEDDMLRRGKWIPARTSKTTETSTDLVSKGVSSRTK